MAYGFVSPRSTEVAKTLLDLAQALGFEAWEVRATVGGYYVPEKVARKYEQTLGAPKEAPKEETEGPSPDETWKNADIKEWAESHGVDLGDATKKADMLAAIQAHKEE
jgi:hypothetical protein